MSLSKEATRKKGRIAEVLEPVDDWARMRNGLRRMARDRGDYSGCPMPLNGQRLVVEPTFKYKGLGDVDTQADPPSVGEETPYKIRNMFWSMKYRARVAVCEDPDGKIWWAPLRGSANSASAILNTIGAADAWGIEQEEAALQLLGPMLRPRQFKQYLLTGSFLETSPRSGVTYVFRKLRPTVAFRESRILCTLCMHPIAYYEESWAGCMCPTDDVVAHLALMRGDERMFWRRSAQHPPWEPESGI